MAPPGITFTHEGIGKLLADDRLKVPVNQREYAWEESHVKELFQDFANANTSDARDYFLGTVVLTQPSGLLPEVTDGQQRLATVSILLAAIRDYFLDNGAETRAASIEGRYLMTTDLRSEEPMPRLTLNVADHEFFVRAILSRPGSKDRAIAPSRHSHELIAATARLAREHVASIVQPYREDARAERLIDWVEFVHEHAKVVVIEVPDSINAFTMFETLNDRGLRAAQSDILKNYLYGKSQDRMAEAQHKWSTLTGALETVAEDDLTVSYLRHHWITKHGPTREKELSARIKDEVTSKTRAMEFLHELAESVDDYVALLNTDHAKWNAYGPSTRNHIGVITRELRVEQIRPLMYAVGRYFEIEQAKKAFRLLVTWSVRFLIVGGRGGLLDRNYSLRAHEIGLGTIKTAKQLAKAMADIVPSDAEFEASFSTARVSQAWLARYYLRALELKAKDDPAPEEVPNEDSVINLEHVLPETPGPQWPIDPDMAAATYKRIGNMVLLKAQLNVNIGNRGFAEKKEVYAQSAYVLTKRVAEYSDWGPQQVAERQKELAALAVTTWPLRLT